MKTTINLLKRLINDKNCSRMNLSVIKGYLGELYVYEILKKHFKEQKIIHKGNQSAYDFEFDKIKIDVKTSTLKDDMNLGFDYWGWALVSGNKKRKINCTHFICLALDKSLNVKHVFVNNSKYLNEFSKGLGRFKNVKKVFLYTDKYKPKYKQTKQKNIFGKCFSLINKKKIIKIRREYEIRSALDCI